MQVENRISIRTIEERDIASIVDYFLNADVSFLHGMGVDPDKLPARENWIGMLTRELSVPLASKKFYYVIWMLNDQPIGHSSLTNIAYPQEAYMHIHMWHSNTRNVGIGIELIRKTLEHYFEDLGFKQLYCEPYALNPAPNKVLEKVGFDFIKDYVTTPGWLCFQQPVKRWLLTAEKFQILKSLQPTLQDELVLITPLMEENFEALYQIASDPLIWEQHPNKNRYQRDVFKVFFKGAIESKGAFLIYDNLTGSLIGTTRYYDVNTHDRSIAIGYTFLSRAYWGRDYNKAAKSLLLQHAFSFAEKVIFHIGANNIRSQKAIEKIGAIKIGELEMSYYGEDNKLNYVYQITKQDWAKEHLINSNVSGIQHQKSVQQ